MDKKTLKALQAFLATQEAAKKKTLSQKLDTGLTLATKAVALVALLTTLLTDVVTKLLPVLETLLGGWPRPGPVTDPGRDSLSPHVPAQPRPGPAGLTPKRATPFGAAPSAESSRAMRWIRTSRPPIWPRGTPLRSCRH